MSIVTTHSVTSRYRKLQYLLQPVPHDDTKVNNRVLAVSGSNIQLIHSPTGKLSTNQIPAYLDAQFQRSMKLAKNPNRRVQSQSIIISFSKDEFDTKNPSLQASQAIQIGQSYVHHFFNDAQSLIVAQCDGKGGKNNGDSKIHLHILIGAVNQRGKTIQTNRFSIYKLRKEFDQTMSNDFQRVTGRKWTGPLDSKERQDKADLYTKSSWQNHLKKVIDDVKTKVDTITDFLKVLNSHGITVTERQKGTHWTYHQQVKTKQGLKKYNVRDFYQRKDKKTGAVIATRGLGTNYTKNSINKYLSLNAQLSPELSSLHQRKEDNHESKQSDEQLERVKTLAAEARIQIEHQRFLNRLTQQQLLAAKDEERRQQRQARRETGQANRQQPQGKHITTVTEQERSRERQKQRIKAKQRASQKSRAKDDGPDF